MSEAKVTAERQQIPEDSDAGKDLHVRVAEALGWTDCARCSGILAPWASGWDGRPPQHVISSEVRETIPRYDLEWEATGPLIVQFGITLVCYDGGKRGPHFSAQWSKPLDDCETCGRSYRRDELSYPKDLGGSIKNPLVAVCNLILALAAAGKLKR